MAYNEFAYFYDEFNGEADYDALYGYITDELKAHGITDGILADLGCGTGDLTLMLTQAGYDVIGIDRSEEMLSVLREKADELGLTGRLLLLKQDLLDLDLYGTIRAAVSTFDTYSHIGPQENFEKAIRKAAYFMERGGVFIFDLNTPYKHRHILAGQTFDIEAEDADCHWSNRYDETAQRVDITINIDYHETGEHFHEAFSEYSYALDTVCSVTESWVPLSIMPIIEAAVSRRPRAAVVTALVLCRRSISRTISVESGRLRRAAAARRNRGGNRAPREEHQGHAQRDDNARGGQERPRYAGTGSGRLCARYSRQLPCDLQVRLRP